MRTCTYPLLIAAVAATLTPFTTRADDTYIGTNTTWSNPAAWSNNAPPSPSDNVFITPVLNPSDTNTLTLDTTATIANLTLGSATGTTILDLGNNSLTATATTISAAAQLTGTGTFTSPFNNAGNINARGGLLTIDMPTNTSPSTNAGTLSASPGANLLLKGGYLLDPANGTFDNTAGTISALGAPTDSALTTFVDLNAVAINGGQLLTNASGQIRIKIESSIANATFSGNLLLQDVLALSNDTLSGNITSSNFGLAALGGHLTNNATFAPMQFTLISNTTINGTGTINTFGMIPQTSLSLTIGQSQTIQGNSTFGGSYLAALTNNGIISANAHQSCLTITNASNASLANHGTLQAINGATLNLGPTSSVFDNSNGLISATAAANGTPSKVTFSSIAISGGQLSTDPLSLISFTSNTTLSNLSLSGNFAPPTSGSSTFLFNNATFTQTVTFSGSNTNGLGGSLINNGTWLVPANTTIYTNPLNPLTLSGTGNLSLSGGNIMSISGTTLVIPSTQTVTGFGQLEISANNGTITANTPAKPFTVGNPDAQHALVNSGTLAATNGGQLTLWPNIQNTGLISATGTSSNITIGAPGVAGTLTGGQLLTDSSGLIFILANTTIDSATLSGRFSFNSASLLRNSALSGNITTAGITNIAGTITNNGLWSAPSLRVSTNAILAGTGTLLVTGGTVNRSTGANATLTVAPAAAIRGYGSFNTIQTGFTLAINNQGTIAADADPTGNGAPYSTPLTLPIILPGINAGTLAAINNGTLQIPGFNGASLDNTLGSISANGGNISLSNLSLTGGQFLSAPANTISLSNVTLNGNITANATLFSNTTLTFAPNSSLNLLHGALILQITDPSTLPATLSQLTAGTLFTSTPGMSLALIDNSSLTVPFTTFAGQPVSPNSLLLTPALPGDANLDHNIDLSDLSTVLNHFGQQSPNWLDGNFDHQPTINLSDLSAVLNNFGQTNPNPSQLPLINSQSPAAPIPEPATLLLLAAPLLFSPLRRRLPT